jgi:uncharacterized membrane protein YeaQ/YmgE (transglycosylase-associated protein family)
MGIGILGWIVLGLIVGALAKLIMPGKDPGGFIITILIGIAGTLLGGFIARTIFHENVVGFFHLRTWGFGLLGALILLGLYHLFFGRRRVG